MPGPGRQARTASVRPRLTSARKAARVSRLEQRILGPGLRVLGVDRLGDDVVVAEQQERLLQRQQLARARLEALHPGELVGELVGADGIAVRQIEIADAHHAAGDGTHTSM